MKVPFDTIFRQKDGELIFVQDTRVMGITFYSGVEAKLCASISFGAFRDCYLDVETEKDVWVVKGIYSKESS